MSKPVRKRQSSRAHTVLQEVGAKLKSTPPQLAMKPRAKSGDKEDAARREAILLGQAQQKDARLRRARGSKKSY